MTQTNSGVVKCPRWRERTIGCPDKFTPEVLLAYLKKTTVDIGLMALFKDSPMSFSRIFRGSPMFLVLIAATAFSQEPADDRYFVQSGDILEISVWREEDLHRDVLVRPDGHFSFPLVGDIDAGNRTVEDLRNEVAQRLERYIPDPVVTVTVKDILGNKIYLLGQVNNPGAFVVNPRVDVMQALSLAGGTTPFAAVNDIVILRRSLDGTQIAMKFEYKDIEKGRNLSQNIMLESGDIVIVP